MRFVERASALLKDVRARLSRAAAPRVVDDAPRRAVGRDGALIEAGQRVQNADRDFASGAPLVVRVVSEHEVVLEWSDGARSREDAKDLVPAAARPRRRSSRRRR